MAARKKIRNKSGRLFSRALELMPGELLAGARLSRRRRHAAVYPQRQGADITDIDGRLFILRGSWGPMIRDTRIRKLSTR